MTHINFILRDYQDADIPHLLAVIQQAFAQYQGQLQPPTSAEHKTVAIIRAELQTANALVIEMAGQIVACVFYRPQDDTIYLDRLAVLPTHRQQGLASALLQVIETRAREQGMACLTLSVRLPLQALQAYYQKLGFTAYAHGTHEGFSEPTYVKMKKLL